MTPYRISSSKPVTCNDRAVIQCAPQPSPWIHNVRWVGQRMITFGAVAAFMTVPGVAGGLTVASLAHPKVEVEPSALLRAARRPAPPLPQTTVEHDKLHPIASLFPSGDPPEKLLRTARAMVNAGLDVDVEELLISNDTRDRLADDSIDDALHDASLEYAGTAILVSRVARRSPMAEAGFHAGDLVITINGRRVGDENFFDDSTGHLAVVELVRDGHRRVHAIRWT